MQIELEPGAVAAALTPPGAVKSERVLLMADVKERDLTENTVSPNNPITVTTTRDGDCRSALVWRKA